MNDFHKDASKLQDFIAELCYNNMIREGQSENTHKVETHDITKEDVAYCVHEINASINHEDEYIEITINIKERKSQENGT